VIWAASLPKPHIPSHVEQQNSVHWESLLQSPPEIPEDPKIRHFWKGMVVMKKQSSIILISAMIVCTLIMTSRGIHSSQAQTPGYLHGDGARLLDANGNHVILTGISWFGLETENYAPHGLWARNWESILDQIVKLGFNTIRLPYSNQLFDSSSLPNSINEELNPDLIGLSGLEILDQLIQGAGERGLKVILDRHRPGSAAQSELWYTPEYSEERWIQDWLMLAERYLGNNTVIGFDLHNEPHGPATWGSGDPATDWRMAAEKAGNAVLAVNPDLLIIVQGIEKYEEDWYWWGGNLMGARKDPVQLDHPQQLVYSPHVYGPGVYPQPWFSAPDFPENLVGIWDRHWGYLLKENIAPVILGEFGGRSVGEDSEGIWQRAIVSYLRENNISYIYWTINPDSGDTGGLLLDDWQTIDPAKQALLSGYQFSIIGIEQGGTPPAPDATRPPPDPTRESTPSSSFPEPDLTLSYRTANPTDQTQDSKPEFILTNTSNFPIPLERAEIRYWFQDESNQPYIYHCDWAQLGCGSVLGDFGITVESGQYLRLHFSPSAGELAPGEDTGEIKIRFNRTDWSTFDQGNHFSFAPQTEYVDWQQISVYFDGQLVWGTEPAGRTAPPATGQMVEPTGTTPPLAAAAQTPTDTQLNQPSPSPTNAEDVSPTLPAPPAVGRTSSVALLLVGVLVGLSLGILVLRFLKRPG
jgi:endoglucanase